MIEIPCALTIAGSDCGGGAGIQADLKTFTASGVYGLSVITALTSQNTVGVRAIEAPGAQFVAGQLDAVMDDFKIAAAKTGMLYSAEIIDVLSERLKNKSFPLVVDPVCVSRSGHRLLKPDAENALIREIFPLADLLTPNKFEAELISGIPIKSHDDIFSAIEGILLTGAKAVLLKGGHIDEDRDVCVDYLGYNDGRVSVLEHKRVNTIHTHGTGCTLSAAITANLALGLNLVDAVVNAQKYLNTGLQAGYQWGKGHNPPNHMASLIQERERIPVLETLERIGFELRKLNRLHLLIPEVRMNVAFALPWAQGINDVAAFHGRISARRSGHVIISDSPGFGASSHIAKVVLAAMRFDRNLRSAANIRFSDRVLKAVERTGMTSVWFNRKDEPPQVKEREGSSLEWGTMDALSKCENPGKADIVADPGEVGKEPMLRILGRDPDDVLEKIRYILKCLD